MKAENLPTAEHEKKRAAMSSVIAAVGLTSLKIIVGVATGSLGILAEAAHSGLDLVAALVTLLAVRVSDKPADKEHHYGHCKVENVSALFETLLLLITCVWIVYEAIQRIFFKAVEMEIPLWAFVIMGISIIVDVNRSRMLYNAACKHKSQALEADALHFSTDIWSSSVVILGLVFVKVSQWVPELAFLHKADAVAALGVALIVVHVSIELGIRTVQALLDTSLPGIAERIVTIVEAIPGVVNCHNVRLRHSGPHVFADLHLWVDGKLSLQEAHALTEKAEETIRKIVPNVDVTVHHEPAPKAVSPERGA